MLTVAEATRELCEEANLVAERAYQTAKEAGLSNPQVRALDMFESQLFQRRAEALEKARSDYGLTEDAKVLVYSIDPQEWETAEPFQTTGTAFLLSFCELSRCPDSIFPYAKRSGPMRLCEHGLPPGHLIAPGMPICTPIGVEPLAAWQSYARVAEAVQVTAGRLHQGLPAEPKDWKVITRYLGFDPMEFDRSRVPVRKIERLHGKLAGTLDRQKRAALEIVNTWCQWAEVATERVWTDTGVVRDETGVGLFGKIARELDYVVARKPGAVTCEKCQNEYVPKKMNEPGIPYFCNNLDCRLEADRLSAIRRRERERERASFTDLVDFAKMRGSTRTGA